MFDYAGKLAVGTFQSCCPTGFSLFHLLTDGALRLVTCGALLLASFIAGAVFALITAIGVVALRINPADVS